MSMEARLRLKDDLDNRLKEVNPEATPGIDIWISELIQNALDATWGDKTGASKIKFEFKEQELIFEHDGRPPQYLGPGQNELMKMRESGSTKKADLSTEGQFGIGFKYWRYYFNQMKIETSGWQITGIGI